MKIISGKFAGRSINSPPIGISRPVTDKVRGAIFSALGERVQEARVLDLYAGSGALGLEALSRGAKQAIFVDQSEKVVRTISKSIAELGVSAKALVKKQKVEKAISDLHGINQTYDLIFFDPPYAEINLELVKILENLLQYSGLVLVSCSSKIDIPQTIGELGLVQKKVYGDTQIGYFANHQNS